MYRYLIIYFLSNNKTISFKEMVDYQSEGIKLTFIRDLARGDLLDHLKLCDGPEVRSLLSDNSSNQIY